jgi:hypothetical protein
MRRTRNEIRFLRAVSSDLRQPWQSSSDARHKREIRLALHPPLRELWTHELLANFVDHSQMSLPRPVVVYSHAPGSVGPCGKRMGLRTFRPGAWPPSEASALR